MINEVLLLFLPLTLAFGGSFWLSSGSLVLERARKGVRMRGMENWEGMTRTHIHRVCTQKGTVGGAAQFERKKEWAKIEGESTAGDIGHFILSLSLSLARSLSLKPFSSIDAPVGHASFAAFEQEKRKKRGEPESHI